MSRLAWLAEKLSERRVARQTSAYLASLAQDPIQASRRNMRELLQTLRDEPGPKVSLGETMWGEPVVVPIMQSTIYIRHYSWRVLPNATF